MFHSGSEFMITTDGGARSAPCPSRDRDLEIRVAVILMGFGIPLCWLAILGLETGVVQKRSGNK